MTEKTCWGLHFPPAVRDDWRVYPRPHADWPDVASWGTVSRTPFHRPRQGAPRDTHVLWLDECM